MTTIDKDAVMDDDAEGRTAFQWTLAYWRAGLERPVPPGEEFGPALAAVLLAVGPSVSDALWERGFRLDTEDTVEVSAAEFPGRDDPDPPTVLHYTGVGWHRVIGRHSVTVEIGPMLYSPLTGHVWCDDDPLGDDILPVQSLHTRSADRLVAWVDEVIGALTADAPLPDRRAEIWHGPQGLTKAGRAWRRAVALQVEAEVARRKTPVLPLRPRQWR